jgi:uncharacterized membrane protein YdbT with pleckstrin-like domain
MNGENLLYSAKLHWVIFLWPIIWFVVAILFFCGGRDFAIAGAIFILIAIITGLVSLINYSTSEFGITNKRVIVKVGLIRRISIEVLLNKIEGIQVNQGILGRILNYGSITVSGTGGTKDPFHKISDPLEFRRKTQEQISSVQESK